ncbi:MAG: metalloregulator ArsR/SmtB family transcription factor [Oscillospiraceae bacterium]
MSSPAVSHHLRQLRSAGLIVSRREGKEVYYRASDTIQAKLFHKLIEEMLEISCPPSIKNPKTVSGSLFGFFILPRSSFSGI